MKHTIRLTVFALIVALGATGCSRGQLLLGAGVIATAGVAGYYYANGDLEVDRHADFKHAIEVAEEALLVEGFTITGRELAESYAELKATGWVAEQKKGKITDDEKTVVVKLELNENGGTRIKIRVGTFGDQATSQRIMAQIDERL